MDPVTQRLRVPRPRDPLAAAVGNASLLGLGYLLLGRWLLAVLNLLVTIALLALLATVASTVWFEVVVLVWWAAVTGHGWYLGARPPRVPAAGVGAQRLVAVGVTVVVLLAFGFLRFDAARIGSDAALARAKGDCAQAVSALERQWLGHRLADAPLAARDDRTVLACGLLDRAGADLRTALGGDRRALDAGYGGLSAVSARLPGHDRMVAATLQRFLAGLPTPDACTTANLTDWLRTERVDGHVPGQAVDALRQDAPAALVGCGDTLLGSGSLEDARGRYQQVLDQWPRSDQQGRATDGITRATLAIQLRTVRGLLDNAGPDTQPNYCTAPQPYAAAAPYNAAGPNHALVFGKDDYRAKFAPGWLAGDVTGAQIVVCVGAPVYGTSQETCPYRADPGTGTWEKNLTFHNVSLPVNVLEIRTARSVFNAPVQVGTGRCPQHVDYPSNGLDLSVVGPPSDEFATPSDDDIRGAFGRVINP